MWKRLGCCRRQSGAAPNRSASHSFVHPSVVGALHNERIEAPSGQSIGMLELKTVASGILCADAGVKSAAVHLARIHPAGFGGKTFVTFWGDQADVEAAVETAADTPPVTRSIMKSSHLLTLSRSQQVCSALEHRSGQLIFSSGAFDHKDSIFFLNGE